MKLPTINKIDANIENCTIYLRSTHKWGKSTLARDVILEKYGDPSCGLSVSCGAERASTMLDSSNIVKVETYEDAIDLKEYLINKVYVERDAKGKVVKKTPVEHNIKIVFFDVVDELFPAFEKYTIKVSNVENPTKKVKTINAAMGGRHNGQFYTADLMKKYMSDIVNAGFGVWALSHSKYKTIKDKGGLEEDGYDQLTSSLMSTYDGVFANIFDVILTGVIDRDIETETSTDGNGNVITKRHVNDEVRKLYFRGTTAIDAGGRFAEGTVPEYMVFESGKNNAAEFIKIIEEGMEKSKFEHKGINVAKPKPTPAPASVVEDQEEPEEIENVEDLLKEEDILEEDLPEENVEETGTESVYPDNLLEEVMKLYKASKDAKLKKEVREIVKGFGRFGDCDNDTLQEIYDMLNN